MISGNDAKETPRQKKKGIHLKVKLYTWRRNWVEKRALSGNSTKREIHEWPSIICSLQN